MGKPVTLQPGMEMFAGYKLCSLLGQGGFAWVWEAETSDGTRRALKCMPCHNGRSAAREIRSIQAIRQLDHPQLIRIEQIWCDLGYIVIAMELADGSLLDLFQHYQDKLGTPIPADLVCWYLAQVAEVIDFLNSRQHILQGQRVGFQHCDLKPSNVLLFGDVVKVTDFGLASATGAMMMKHRRQGTIQYAAPEVFQGRLSDWTDQYSLAVSYCQLRGGRLPFPEVQASGWRSQDRATPDLSMLPDAERPIIARALATVPQDRWSSCLELMQHLAAAIV